MRVRKGILQFIKKCLSDSDYNKKLSSNSRMTKLMEILLLDLYKQVSGNAGGYQLDKAKNGMMLNIGGSATTNYVFIVGRE